MKEKMKLGPVIGWSLWTPTTPAPWPRERWGRENQGRGYWDAVRSPYYRFHDHVALKRTYRSGPSPWRPGRYTTAKWQPWSGYGRFSGLRDILRGAYHAARYTGHHVTPEHYILRHHGQEAYEAQLASNYRKRSWRATA